MKKNNKQQNIILWIVLAVCIVILSASSVLWNPSAGEKESENSADQKHKVALITKSTVSAFWKTVYSGASNASTAYNMELIFEGPDNEEDYQAQNDMIRKVVEEGVDVIIFSAVDYRANAEAINQAAGQGVKIIIIDSDVNSDQVSCRIGTDNYEAGCMAGEAALEDERETIRVGIVNFDKNSDNGQKREEGFRDTVLVDDRVSIVDTINVISTTEDAQAGTEEMLKKHPEINVIVTFNEWTSLGVGNAVQKLGLADETRVIAFDSNVRSVGMLETGEVDTLIVQNPYAMGYLGVETAYKLLNGYTLANDTIFTDTMAVDRNNMYDEECQRRLFAFEKSNKN
ncbi:MAG: substrate-binding domain-containing protein [Firmicutes bacterium]|nr:substrate-binding domain-containing protein [Lachnospiraceae bacterium]MDD6065255.1 substrate-binding domain-containing protein [Bacillota bacterium]